MIGRDSSCRWVERRLPLLAGGELLGHERRRAERHVIGCASCRGRLASHRESLDALRSAGLDDPVAPDSPSLWPALARQIRETRRPAPSWGFPRAEAWTWARLGLAAGVLALAFGLGLWTLGRHYRVQVTVRPVRPPASASPSPSIRLTSQPDPAVPSRTDDAPEVVRRDDPPTRPSDPAYDNRQAAAVPTN